jgi:hypothetical protein
MQVFCIVNVERRQQREYIGLNGADQQLKRADEHDQQEARQADQQAIFRASIKALHDEAAKHLQQDMAGGHRDKQSQSEAERADHEGDKLDQENQRKHHNRRAIRNEQREEFEFVLPETDREDDREAHNRHRTGDHEMAGHGERMAAHDADRHKAKHIGEQDEHEDRKHEGDIFLTLRSDARRNHIVYEAGQPLNGELPAAGDQLALHAAPHEQPDRDKRNHHPHGGVREHDASASGIPGADKRLNLKLVHRIDFAAFSHAYKSRSFSQRAPKIILDAPWQFETHF